MANEQDEKLGLDASGMESSLDRLENRFDRLSSTLDETARQFADVATQGDRYQKTLQTLNERGETLSSTYEITANKIRLVSAEFSALTSSERSYLTQLKSTIQGTEEYGQSLDRLYTKLQSTSKIRTEALQAGAKQADDLRVLKSFLESSTSGTNISSSVSDERRNLVAQGLLSAELERARTTGQTTHLLEEQNQLFGLLSRHSEEQAAIEASKLTGQAKISAALSEARDKSEQQLAIDERNLVTEQGLLSVELERARASGQTAHILQEQAVLFKENEQHARLLAQYQKEQADILTQKQRGQLQITKELTAAQEKAARASAADSTGEDLRGKLISGRGLNSRDEARALASLGQIQAAIRSGAIEAQRANAIVDSVIAKEGQVFEGAELRVANSANKILNTNSQLEDSFKKVGETGEKSGLSILLSWQSLSRLLAVQLLHTGIREVLNLMTQAISEAQQFETRIAEIQTISQGNAHSFDEWTASVKALSDQFGSPILDTTEAFYQALSSQLVQGADAADLVTRALEFSRVTASSTAQSMNLLASAMNSYHLSAAEADRVQGVLFKTITLGKLRAEDLAQTFGRVGPFAHELGISIEEVGASIATLTRSGVPASEAVTLIEAVLTRLVKPSNEMKKFLEDIGVSSGTNAIQIYGFANVLSKLEQATHGSSEELAKLFPRLESLRGSLSLTSNLDGFQKNLDDIRQNGLPQFKQALDISFRPPAFELQQQLQKIKNFLLIDFAEPAIKGIVDLGKSLSKDGLSGAFEELIPLISLGVKGVTAYVAATTIMSGVRKLDAFWTEAQTKAGAENVLIRQLEREAVQAEALAVVELTRAEQLLMAIEAEEAEVAYANAAAHTANAASLRSMVATQEIATTSGIALKGAMSGLLATLTSPAFLITAGAIAITSIISNIKELEAEQNRAAKQSYDIATETNRKIGNDLEKQLSVENDLWDKALNLRFVSYTEFAGGISHRLREVVEAETNFTEDAIASAKQSIQDFVHSSESDIHKIEEAQKEALRNVQDARRAINKENEDFADKEFQRKLALAQQQDALGTPGRDLHLVDQNQINLENDELKRLKAEKTLSGGTDPKAELEAHKKNLADQEKIVNDLFTRRLRLEQERKTISEQLIKAQSEFAEHQATAATRSEASKILPGGKHSSENSGVRQGLKEEAEAQRELNQQQSDEKTLAALEARADALDKSLAVLPKINEFEKTFKNLQEESRKSLEQFIALQQKAATEAEKQAKIKQENFEKLKVTLTELEKLQFSKVLDSSGLTRGKADDFLGNFDRLLGQAQSAGLQDQGVLSKLISERAKIEEAFNTKLEEITQREEAERINQIKNEIESRKRTLTATVTSASKSILEIGADIESIIGHSEQDKERGSLGQAITTKATHFAGVRTGPDDEQLKRFKKEGIDVEAVREQYRLIVAQIAASGNKVVSPEIFKPLIDQVNKLNEGINSENSKGQAGTFLPNVVAQGNRFDAQGRKLPDLTVQDEVKRLFDLIGAAQSTLVNRNTALAQSQQQERLLQSQLDRLRQIEKSQVAQNQAIIDNTKSFQELGAELVHIIDGMENLRLILDKFPTPVVEHKAFGGVVGGSNYGIDTIPAMLTKEEFVVNASASKKFRPELEWMNSSGQYSPIVSKVGNRQTSMNFGAINIALQSNGNARVDAKSIVTALQRELRLSAQTLGTHND